MRRTSIIAAAIGGLLVSSSAFAGFTVTAAKVDSGAFDIWNVTAVNTGGDTGVQVKGLEYAWAGTGVFFQVDDLDENGTADTVAFIPPTTTTDRSRLRVNTVASNNTFVGSIPTNNSIEPNPYGAPTGINAFSGAIANTGTTNATGAGFQIARLVLADGGSGVFSGNIGGDTGAKVPFSVQIGTPTGPTDPTGGNTAPVITNDGASTNVVFGQIVTNGAPFSIIINATDVNAADLLSLAVGALPAGVSGVTVSPATSGSPAAFTVTGTVDYSLNGTTVNVPFTVSDNGNPILNDTGSFSIVVTPEPASLSLLGLGGLLLGRRRK